MESRTKTCLAGIKTQRIKAQVIDRGIATAEHITNIVEMCASVERLEALCDAMERVNRCCMGITEDLVYYWEKSLDLGVGEHVGSNMNLMHAFATRKERGVFTAMMLEWRRVYSLLLQVPLMNQAPNRRADKKKRRMTV